MTHAAYIASTLLVLAVLFCSVASADTLRAAWGKIAADGVYFFTESVILFAPPGKVWLLGIEVTSRCHF